MQPKDDDDVNMGMREDGKLKLGKRAAYTGGGAGADIDWAPVVKNFEKTERPQLALAVTNSLLQTKGLDAAIMSSYQNNESRESFIKSTVINVMSTPEYQLC